jgi:hypothetical protein
MLGKKKLDDCTMTNKCPFCDVPCGNDHCPYYEEYCDKIKLKGLEEENKRLKEQIRDIVNWKAKCEY